MNHWISQRLFDIQIKVLLALKPTVLFHKINQLEWYQDTLRQWINSHKFNRNIKLLEVGSATGSLSGYLAECGYITTAVDSSEAMIANERRTTKSGGFLATTRRAGAIFAPSVVVGRLFRMTKLRFLRLTPSSPDCPA